MVLREMVNQVQYPDETEVVSFDATLYEELVAQLKEGVETLQGQSKIDCQDTLNEVERLWAERQKVVKIRVTDTSAAFNRLQPQPQA